MNRFTRIAAAGSLAILAAGPALAQQAQVQGVKTQPTVQQGITYGGVVQTPWFSDKAARDQVKFSNDQYNALNKAYGEAWTNYNSNLGRIGGTLTEAQRAQKTHDLQAVFNQNVNGSVDRLITDPQQRERYRQLHIQYQGYSAFNDPTIQHKLNLTNEQREKLTQYGQDWNRQMGTLHQSYQTDPAGATQRYNEMVQQNNQRYNTVLNQQQQATWQQMTGAPYNFAPGLYFQRVGGK
jgi:hypothetical protein